jgi:RND family efflux transporter MFP subunit
MNHINSNYITMLKGNLHTTLFIFMVAGFASCSGGGNPAENISEKPVTVTLATASAVSQHAILASGEVEADQTANISTRVMGRITNIYVKAGDKVNQGQLLATISDEDILARRAQTDATIAEAAAALTNAQKDYDRFSNLYKQQSATAKELDNVTLQFNSAKAKVDAARQMRSEIDATLSYASLRAPFSGVVTQKLAEAGSISNPGMPLLTIEDNKTLQVSASVAESDISHIHLGDAAHLEIKSMGKSFEGKIVQINPSSQFTGAQYIVKITIPKTAGKEIYAGMFANVNIPVTDNRQIKNDMVLISASAVVRHDELTGVYSISAENTALLRWIRLGKTYGDKVEVISGLSKDEKFISSSESRLYNGAPVICNEIPGVSMLTGSK